jgi:hypothetical protein
MRESTLLDNPFPLRHHPRAYAWVSATFIVMQLAYTISCIKL